MSATIVGIFYLQLFAANILVGHHWRSFGKNRPQFWLLHSALCGTAGIIFLVAGHFFGHLLAPGDKEKS